MPILHSVLSELKNEFALSRKGEKRSAWFINTLLAIILPFTSSRTSSLLRALEIDPRPGNGRHIDYEP